MRKFTPISCWLCMFVTLLTLMLLQQAHAQTSTYQQVHTLLKTNCSLGGGCHNTASANPLKLDGSMAAVYTGLIEKDPINGTAKANGLKLVDPGYPHRSFLFKKINNGLDPHFALEAGEGTPMPQSGQALDDHEIELVRQWILFGAPDTGTVVDSMLLVDFYAGKGKRRTEVIAPPAAGEGFQIHHGPFFVPPMSDWEFFKKYETLLPDSVEVNRLKVQMNDESHHFALYKYYPDSAATVPDGLRPVTSVGDAADVFFKADVITQWPNSEDIEMPEGTAFFWEGDVVLDVNYHIPNLSPDSILAAELYLNIYTRPRQAGTVEMKSAPIYYGGLTNPYFSIYPTGTDTTLRIDQFDASSNETWYIWAMQAHTHTLGRDFNVYRRTASGGKGLKVYEGTFDPTCTFDQNFYDWEHPPFCQWRDPLLEVPLNLGLVHEAVFNNSGSDTVNFGLGFYDEMFVTYMHYTTEKVSGIHDKYRATADVQVYPNPFSSTAMIRVNSDEIDSGSELTLELYELSGKLVKTLGRDAMNITAGGAEIRLDKGNLAKGSYLFNVTDGKKVNANGKVVIF